MSARATAPERQFDAGGPLLSDIGEAELLRRLRALAPRDHGLLVPTGDDAMVWRAGDASVVVSQDATVEGEDFRRGWTTPRRVGRRAVRAALSDLAGMGAKPAWCLATLCAPPTTCVDDVMALQGGIVEAAAEAGCALAGGDVSGIDGPIVVDVCAGGTVAGESCLRRDRGRPGDAVVVTGVLGRAAAGLRLLLEGSAEAAVATSLLTSWIDAQLEPPLRIGEGLELLSCGVACGGDLSDGLLADAARLAQASGCGVELWLDAVPLDAGFRDAWGDAWIELALGGGEDFELLATVPRERAAGLLAAWPGELAPLTVVGGVTSGAGVRLLEREGGAPLPPPAVRSGHFGPPP